MPTARFAAAYAGTGPGHAFGVSGSGQSLELIDGLEKGGVRFHAVQFEGSAAIMAGTVGRLSGRPGLAVSIKGPGLANMVPGLAACRFEAMPCIAVAEAYGPDVPEAKAHKRMDQTMLTGAVVKGRRWLSQDAPGYEDLAAWAAAESPAPVLAELAGAPGPADAPIPAMQVADDNGDVLALIEKAERPVVIAGGYAERKGWSQQLNRLQIPVFSTAAAKGVVHEGLPHAAGVYTGVGLELAPETSIVGAADLVVGLGLRAGDVLAAKPFDVPAVNLDDVESPGQDGFAFAATGTDGNSALALLARKAWGVSETAAATAKLRDHMVRGPQFLPAHALAALAAAYPNGVRVVIDTGYFCTIAEHAWQAPKMAWCVSSGSGRYMGIGLPQAVAAAVYDPAVPTVLVVGDGGLGPFFAEARLAARAGAPLAILHMSDGGYGSVRTRAIATGLTQAPLLTPDTDWRPAFEGIGFATAHAGSAEALQRTLSDWDTSQAPLFVTVPFDPDAYQAMVAGIR